MVERGMLLYCTTVFYAADPVRWRGTIKQLGPGSGKELDMVDKPCSSIRYRTWVWFGLAARSASTVVPTCCRLLPVPVQEDNPDDGTSFAGETLLGVAHTALVFPLTQVILESLKKKLLCASV